MFSPSLTIGYPASTPWWKAKQAPVVIHSDLRIHLRAGELTCLLGANGAGKSTLLRTLSGTQAPLAGQLFLHNRPIEQYSERELSREIGLVLTDRTTAGGLTVYQLVALGRQPHTGFFGRLRPTDHDRIAQALEQVGMAHKSRHYMAQLSDGERQKAMIAKALVQECPIILLDEPTAFLDAASRIEILSLLHRLAVEQRKAILLSTHEVEHALVQADRLWLLTPQGMTCGTPEDLVLGHHLDRLFPQSDLKFDYYQGTFRPPFAGSRHICLIAPDATLRHWAFNALSRQGFVCEVVEDLHDVPAHRLILQAIRPTQLLLHQGDKVTSCSSFEELREVTKELERH